MEGDGRQWKAMEGNGRAWKGMEASLTEVAYEDVVPAVDGAAERLEADGAEREDEAEHRDQLRAPKGGARRKKAMEDERR